jgi:peptide deformylase
MSILKVARMGHPVLRQKARPIDKQELMDPRMQKLIDDMIETMHEYSGIGLAAPQIHEGRAEGEASVIINPQISVIGDKTVEGWEGCLSIPDIRGMVPRAFHINVVALDRQGKHIEFEAKDFPARVVQHETDHLNGILFFDRMRSFESLTYMEEFSR